MDYKIDRLDYVAARDFVTAHHYSRGCANTHVASYGLFEGRELIGAMMFATPCSEAVRASVFGPDHKSAVTELHRLIILDVTPKNTESWFISRCLKLLKADKPHILAVPSFADPSAGHVGTIYQATNALYYGTSKPATFFVDGDGRLRHPRQCGRNISFDEARELGWRPIKRPGKHRYCFFVPDRAKDILKLRERSRLRQVGAYPRPATMNGSRSLLKAA